MMNDELKEIFSKQELTDEEKKKAQEALDAFDKEIDEVCRKHGIAHRAILVSSKDGIVPGLEKVLIKEPAVQKEGNA